MLRRGRAASGSPIKAGRPRRRRRRSTCRWSRPTRRSTSNRAILITAALVTAILAMVASYVDRPLRDRQAGQAPPRRLRRHRRRQARRSAARSRPATSSRSSRTPSTGCSTTSSPCSRSCATVNDDLDRKVDELAQANLALFEMNRLKSDFLATMSHELRTPAELDHRLLRGPLRQRPAQRAAAAVRDEHPDLGQDAPGDDQRHPRPGQDRERQDGGPHRGLLDPRRLRGARRAWPGRSPSGRTSTWSAGSTRRSRCCGRTRASSGRSSTTCSPTRSSSRPRGAGSRSRPGPRGGSSVIEVERHRDRDRRGGPREDLREVPPGRRPRARRTAS